MRTDGAWPYLDVGDLRYPDAAIFEEVSERIKRAYVEGHIDEVALERDLESAFLIWYDDGDR